MLPLLLSLLACASSDPKSVPKASRVDVPVAVESAKADAPAEWCEVKPAAGQGPTFALPALAGAPMASSGKPRWVNVWATWCGPCVEEMPRLLKMQQRLAKEGVDIDLQFLSVDEDAGALAAWKQKNPSIPTMHVAAYADVFPWFKTLGIENQTLPTHIFVGADGKVSCARSAAVEDHHYASVKQVLSGK